MKRFAFMLVVLILMWTGCASAWEPSEELIDFAAEVVPGYTMLDGCIFDETAMLLLEDEDGLVYFAGCVNADEGWKVTMSTAFPAWLDVALDTYHAGDGDMRLWTDCPPEMRAYEDETLDIYIELAADDTWRVWGVNTGWDVIEFYRQRICNMNFDYFGDITIPLDITQIDWAALPFSFHEAMALADTTRWRLVAVQDAPVYAAPDPGSTIISLGASGAPVQVISAEEGWVQVQFIGRTDTGWMLADDLLPGDIQIPRYEAWCENGNDCALHQIILKGIDPTVSWYTIPHDESTAMPFVVDYIEYAKVLGWCSDVCCYHLYSEKLGTSAYVPITQLPYMIE